jgi:hypothetical protein
MRCILFFNKTYSIDLSILPRYNWCMVEQYQDSLDTPKPRSMWYRRIGCLPTIVVGLALSGTLAWELGIRARVVLTDHDINAQIFKGNAGLVIGATKVDSHDWRPVLVNIPPES